MPLPDYAKTIGGTAKTLRSSGGDASITLTSLPNGNGLGAGAWQSATLDLGASWAQRWRVDTEFEFAAATAGNAVEIHVSYQNGNGAGLGATSGTDSAYTGYASNIDASLRQLQFVGAHVCTANATPTVQKCMAGTMFPQGRYLNVVVNNKSGGAFHSSPSNIVIRFTPLEEAVQEDV